jgi:hypothetical protein
MTQDELKSIFVYEPATGMLRRYYGGRKPYPWRRCGKGGKYLACTVGAKSLYLHQGVFLYHHGYLPAQVDHIDRGTTNNRIANLRPATHAENQYNSRKKSNNRSGAKGVVFHKACKSRPWQAKIVVGKQTVSLGYYATVAQAADAYEQGAKHFAKAFAFRGQ